MAQKEDDAVAGAILAGGLARRMGGANKAALQIGGRRIIDRQMDLLRTVASPVFIVAADAAPFRDLDVRVVADAIPGAGPLGGIYTAIVSSPRPRTIAIACDMPFLSAALLQRLTRHSEADIVIPRTEKGYEALCAVYSKTCADAIRRRIERGALTAYDVVSDLRVEEIGPEALAAYDPHGLLFMNVNTPHDYERALGLMESELKPTSDRITDNRGTE